MIRGVIAGLVIGLAIPYAFSALTIGDVMAICENGRISMSENRRGTCSHNGGVWRWIDGE